MIREVIQYRPDLSSKHDVRAGRITPCRYTCYSSSPSPSSSSSSQSTSASSSAARLCTSARPLISSTYPFSLSALETNSQPSFLYAPMTDSLQALHCGYGCPTIWRVLNVDRKPRSWCGRRPKGCSKSSAVELAEVVAKAVKAEAELVGGDAAARARSGCWRIDTRSSTNRAEAMGAMPGRVTVHC